MQLHFFQIFMKYKYNYTIYSQIVNYKINHAATTNQTNNFNDVCSKY